MRTFLDMLDRYRSITQDKKTPPVELVEKLRWSDAMLYHELGGITNPEVAAALRTVVNDVVSPERSFITLPQIPGLDASFSIDGQTCKIIPRADEAVIARFPSMKPAASVDAATVRFFPYGTWTSGTKPVSASYTRTLRPMYYVSGLNARIDETNQFGIAGRSDLTAIDIVFPAIRPTIEANELSGGYVSLQWDAASRIDYLIEQHEAGPLFRLYVNAASAHRVYQYDVNFAVQDVDGDAVLATVSRASDLPDKYYPLIVDRAIRGSQPTNDSKPSNQRQSA